MIDRATVSGLLLVTAVAFAMFPSQALSGPERCRFKPFLSTQVVVGPLSWFGPLFSQVGQMPFPPKPPVQHAADQFHAESLHRIDGANEAVFALRRFYPAGLRVPRHCHARTQFWFARSGVVLVNTDDGRWMIPASHGLIIPAGLEHSTEMISDVEMQSIYVAADVAGREGPRVVAMSDLAGCLIADLVKDEGAPGLGRRQLVMDLLLDEVSRLEAKPLGLPFPEDERLVALCRRFLDRPDAGACIDEWAGQMGVSRRSFSRRFRIETGVSFGTWRQQACVLAALPMLARGEPVTSVALDVGYENVAAFTTMFRRMLGSSPSAYLRSRLPRTSPADAALLPVDDAPLRRAPGADD